MAGYPRIGQTEMRDKNTSAKCRCGAIAKRRVHIQVSWYRGEDEVIWSCMDHRKDIDYLIGFPKAEKARTPHNEDRG